MNSGSSGWHYLHRFLGPMEEFLAREDVTDLYVNRPGEIWLETLGGATERHDVTGLTDELLGRLVEQVAALSAQGINREHPLLSASLPDGSRIQAIAPPATRGSIALAIRKHLAADISLADYASAGFFGNTKLRSRTAETPDYGEADSRIDTGDAASLVREAVIKRRNILVAGGTSTGKTTFLNALIREIPERERLIVIEDTPELQIRHANALGLLAVRGHLGEAKVSADDLVSASLRMRPDRIILGELRGPEAYAFLRAINTGHPGSMTTVHADNPESAVEQVALLILQAGTRLSRQDVQDYVRSSIGLYVQLERRGGKRLVSEIVCR